LAVRSGEKAAGKYSTDASKKKIFDVLLAGYYGFGNLGDELLASSAVDWLVTSGVKKERIAILSGDPAESRLALGIEAFGRGLASRSLANALSVSRSMFLAGGGIFQDSSSVRSCLYYWGLVRKSLNVSCPVAAVSQSIGPLSSFISKKMTKDALSRCGYLSVRDRQSLSLAGELGLLAELSPDLVMGLEVPRLLPRESGLVLINVRPVKNAKASESVLAAARACADVGLGLRGIAFSPDDEPEFERFISNGSLPKFEVIRAKCLDDFVAASEDAFAAIGMRLHFGVLSLLRGLRLAMVPYDPKVSDFAEKWDALCPELAGIGLNSDIMRLLTKCLFKDKKQPDHGEAARALADVFKKALGLVLGDE
jgi:polysaccharide pyruvyl transferase CsaB